MISSMWHILALVLAIGCAFLFYYLIRLVMQVSETLKTLEKSVQNIQEEVIPIINNIEGITGNVEGMSDKATEMVVDLQDNTKNTVSVFKHSLFLIYSYFFRYLKAISTGLAAGSDHYKSFSYNSNLVIVPETTTGIIDHIEKMETNS